jgi:hypothetical protein
MLVTVDLGHYEAAGFRERRSTMSPAADLRAGGACR